MSAALAESIVQSPKALSLVPGREKAEPHPVATPADQHPLLTVVIAAAIAAAGAALFVGSILAWLALRDSGINAAW